MKGRKDKVAGRLREKQKEGKFIWGTEAVFRGRGEGGNRIGKAEILENHG